MSELDDKAREESRKRRSGFVFNRSTKGEDEMDKHTSKGQTKGPMNRHKEMAEGQKIKAFKKGGEVHKDEKEDKKLIKKMVKKEDLKMAKGGSACMKKGGESKKKK